MELIEGILTRRSIRKFRDEKIGEDILDIILKCAMAAPSAGNVQPWHFVIIDDRLILEQIRERHPFAKMLSMASVAILVCGELSSEKYWNRWMLDTSAASQNILLAAHALGIGSVWIGIYPDESRISLIKELVNLPDNMMPNSLIALGYPDEKKETKNSYNPSKIHKNRF